MELTSVKQLTKKLISLAIQRCRLSGVPCRLSVIVKQSQSQSTLYPLPLTLTHVSISDTGAGSCLKEFQDMKYVFPITGWDGQLSITTTGVNDSEISHYNLNLKEIASNRRMTKLPSTSKNNAIFSGTEVSMATAEDMMLLLADMTSFLRQMIILKMHDIAVELIAIYGDEHGLQHEKVLLSTELTSYEPADSSIEQLTIGLEEYVYKHRNNLGEICQSCFSSSDTLKTGKGHSRAQKPMLGTLVMEVVIMISELLDPPTPSCLNAFEPKTEVLYFRDFVPSEVPESAVKAIRSINWNSYGLTLKSIADEDGSLLLEWDSLPENSHIHIAIHCYNEQVVIPPLKQRAQVERNLVKKSTTLALDNLKETYEGVLLSAHALKIRGFVPDLARSIAGLILTSDDLNFQGECFSLLGMRFGDVEEDLVESCITDKLIAAIDLNDRKTPSLRSTEAAPYLFGNDNLQELEYMLDDYEEGIQDGYASMDF